MDTEDIPEPSKGRASRVPEGHPSPLGPPCLSQQPLCPPVGWRIPWGPGVRLHVAELRRGSPEVFHTHSHNTLIHTVTHMHTHTCVCTHAHLCTYTHMLTHAYLASHVRTHRLILSLEYTYHTPLHTLSLTHSHTLSHMRVQTHTHILILYTQRHTHHTTYSPHTLARTHFDTRAHTHTHHTHTHSNTHTHTYTHACTHAYTHGSHQELQAEGCVL